MLDDAAAYLYFEDVNWGLLRLWGNRTGLDVLDVGCGFATTSQIIQDLGNRVTGIEENLRAVEVARRRLNDVIPGNLTELEFIRKRVGEKRFDVIIFADVLEHLPWPNRVMEAYLPFLKPDGRVLISLPNVGLWSVRLGLLFGRFNYQDTGVLDRTHLRFFTRKSMRSLIESVGLSPTNWTYTPGLLRPFIPALKRLMSGAREAPEHALAHNPRALLDSRAYALYRRMVMPSERLLACVLPGFFAFQMVVEGRKREGA